MSLRLRKESGFTIIELLIVIVVIGILAGLVMNVFTGIQADGRDAERKTDLEAMEGHLEAYAAKNNGVYPTSADVDDVSADATFISTNFDGLDTDAMIDPTSGDEYVYTATPSTPSACDNATTECSGYTLCADLETDGRGSDDADSDTCDETRTSNQ